MNANCTATLLDLTDETRTSIGLVTLLPLISGALLLLSKRALDLGMIAHEDASGANTPGNVKNANIIRMFLVIFAVCA